MLASPWSDVRRILVARLDNIGDMVMTTPALRSIKAALPDAHLTLLASPAGSQVAEMLPWVDDVITMRALWQDIDGGKGYDLSHELELIARLHQGNYDALVILTSFSQTPYPLAYAATLAGIPLRLGQSKEFGGGVLTEWVRSLPDDAHQVDRNLATIHTVGFPDTGRYLELELPVEAANQAALLLEASGVDMRSPYIVLAPGASCAARRYDPQRFARLASLMYEQAGLPIVLLGSARESALLDPFIRQNVPVVSLIGRTSVPEMSAAIAASKLVIANDSAAMHIADAFNRPMLILFSGTEMESQWEPRFSPARLLRRHTACAPCHRFTCPFNLECLDIAPGEAAVQALGLLELGLAARPNPLSTLTLLDEVIEDCL
jgi:lipopolysaccharide heptosyltransferase II